MRTECHIAIVDEPIDVAGLFARVADHRAGAVTSFVGTVRCTSGAVDRDGAVELLEYEAYEPMAIAECARILDEVQARFKICKVAVEHRIGRLSLGEIAVAIVVATPHRATAFEACRFIIEELKQRVPIWKKEVFADGAAWVDNRP